MGSGRRNRLWEGQVLTGILGMDPTPPGGMLPAKRLDTKLDTKLDKKLEQMPARPRSTAGDQHFTTENTPVVDHLPLSLWDQMIDAVEREFFVDAKISPWGSPTPRPLNHADQDRSRATLAGSTWAGKPGRHGT